MRVAFVVITLLALLAACGGGRGDVSIARQIAADYLEHVTGGATDRGWSLILPDSRRAYADREEYLALVSEADWGAFRWRLIHEGDYCEDGGVYCVVHLDIPGAPGSLPSFLLEPPQSRQDDRFQTFRLDDDSDTPGNAEMVIYFAPTGERGVLLGGG